MLYNDLKKGHEVICNGFNSTIADNLKGIIRTVSMESNVMGQPEMGSTYIWTITDRNGNQFEMSKAQKKKSEEIKLMGF